MRREVIGGIAAGCRQAGCALVGGETAEMPGLYAAGRLRSGRVQRGGGGARGAAAGGRGGRGHACWGWRAAGCIATGFRWCGGSSSGAGWGGRRTAPFAPGRPLGEALLEPTRIYVRPMLALHRAGLLKAAAHITGGGLPGICRGCCRRGCGRCWMRGAGRCRRCSGGWRGPAGWRRRRCCGCSIAGSAWRWWSPTRRRRCAVLAEHGETAVRDRADRGGARRGRYRGAGALAGVTPGRGSCSADAAATWRRCWTRRGRPDFPAEAVLVLANVAGAGGLEVARGARGGGGVRRASAVRAGPGGA